MNKYLLKTACLLLISNLVFAQSKEELKYKEKALKVQEEIWNNGDKAFEVTTVPEKYNNESAVIIARSVEVSNSASRKFKMTSMFGGSVKQYQYFTSLRERILIKDKSALEEYSTLNYKKLSDNTVRISLYKLLKTSKTYIGAKIFKSSGKVIEINPSEEEVLTKNKSKDKEGKIAIPDLQVGDILDYYIYIEEVVEGDKDPVGPHAYFLADDYPILNYHVKYILDRKSGADVMSLNGAKEIAETTNEDKDIILEFTEKDLPRINNTLWTSLMRQIPYHIIRYGFPGPGMIAKAGEVNRGPFTTKYKSDLKLYLYSKLSAVDKTVRGTMEEYFGGKKNMKDLPHDSIVNYLFNYYRWQQFGSFSNMDVSNRRNANTVNWFNIAISFTEILRLYNIKADIVIAGNRYAERLKDVFGAGDFHLFVRVNSNSKFKWICFNSFFVDAGKLGAIYQGEDALILTKEGSGVFSRFSGSETAIELPVSQSDENVLAENIKVSFNSSNMQLLNIDRTSSYTGYMKLSSQVNLMLAEDVEAGLAGLIKKKASTDKLAEFKKEKQRAAEIQTALDNERLKQKDYFKDEIKGQYDQEPKELLSFKITNNGLSYDSPAFEYTETFTMTDFVKKAGNNFILDAGRLMGAYKKIEGKDTVRTLDVYMPSARQLNYEISIAVPDGYTVKGIEEMNKKLETDVASFVSAAKLDGNQVNITVHRTYNNNFEPAANWPKVLAAMNAAADFTNLKLLLEKK